MKSDPPIEDLETPDGLPPGEALSIWADGPFESYEQHPDPRTGLLLLWTLLFEPVATPSRFPVEPRVVPALAFATGCAAVSTAGTLLGLVSTLSRVAGHIGPLLTLPGLELDLASLTSPASLLGFWLIGTLLALVSLLGEVLSVHLCLRLCRCAAGGLRATFGVLAYSSAGGIMGLLPLLGGPLSMIWIAIIQILGLMKVHRTDFFWITLALSLPVLAAAGVLMVVVIAVLLR